MNTMKKIRASLGFTKTPDGKVLSRGAAVHSGMTGNPDYPNSPVDLAVFQTELDRFSAAIADALDGGKRAIIERDRQREIVIALLEQLGHYVEANCKGDMAIFASSGFEAASTTRRNAPALPRPAIRRIEHGKTGELLGTAESLPRVRVYEWRYAALDGNTPGPWTTETVNVARTPVSFDGLIPGTTYAFQVRARGKHGFTDWSDSATRMCT